ncbi:recombinase family protein [Sinorhizobium meliloti]|uniref:recombinase family protein n=1 Tax=Rhizobium meliloti TaxID=382 RepID=UPI001F32704E|nr:recombinase family protein [Sinorhizobium meliloti]
MPYFIPTGTNRAKSGLDQALAEVRGGDTLVVRKLDRQARSVPDARAIGNEPAALDSQQLQERREIHFDCEAIWRFHPASECRRLHPSFEATRPSIVTLRFRETLTGRPRKRTELSTPSPDRERSS